MTDAGRRYRPDIDGLRAIAVSVVLVYHAFPVTLPGGFIGVDVFFVISGYLISGIVLADLAARRFSFAHFYARRIRRIFPTLALLSASVLAAGWFLLYADDYLRVGGHVAAGAAFVSNLVLWRESSYFDVAADLKPLLHLWSLAIEEQFYLVWPLALVIASRWRRGPLATTLAVGAISLLLAIWTVRVDRTAAFYAPWNRFWELLAGAMLACIEADAALHGRMQQLMSRRWLPDILASTGLAAIVAGVVLINSTRVFPGLWALLPVGGTVLLIVAGPRAWVNGAILSQPPVVFIGLISYPLYLWHWPLLSFAQILDGGVPPARLRLALLAVSVLLAWATYRLLERPIRFGSHRPAVVPGLVAAMSVLAAAGVTVYSYAGLIERPVNRSSGAGLVNYYERLRNDGLSAEYRFECDFMDAKTGELRDTLDPACTIAGRAHTVFLWGDSFAQALSLGIRESLPPDAALAQVATSSCAAAIEERAVVVANRRCQKANLFAMDSISRLRPDVVIVAQSDDQEHTDWAKLTSAVLSIGAGHVVIVGPSPQWRPSLPRVYAEHHLRDRPEFVASGLASRSFEVDRLIAARVTGLAQVTYLSLLGHLCHDGACLARVPGGDPLDLMVLDFGHLTPKGSSYLGRKIWKPYFEVALR